MCGIAGLLNFDGGPIDQIRLMAMSAIMKYRGPDDSGEMVIGSVGLAARRLAIIDLSDAGHQPMTNDNRSIWLVFNGEIYNHIELRDELEREGYEFRSRCDTEVILRSYEAWGQRCIERFNGMFAFAIWDSRDDSLWLVRDRLGVKPLYYAKTREQLIFGSEIKQIFKGSNVRPNADAQAISEYIRYGYTLGDKTWFQGVRKLLPGHHMTVRDGRVDTKCWWDPADQFRSAHDVRDAAPRIRELLADSVRLRIRSDVPVGSHLSGGLDSSSVVALMASSLDHPVHTFSGKFSEGELYDESYYSDIVSNRFGTEHRTVVPDAGGFQEHMPKLIWHMDEPAVGAGVFPQYMVCRLARENGVVVVNGGQGGDELFAGYPKYLEPRQGRLKTRMRRGMTFQAGLTRRFRQSAGPVSPLPSVLDDPLANEMYNDLRLYLAALLHVEDRTSMAVSLESRTPFIDYRLVELASSISTMQKMSGGLKSLLIQAMADVLPNEIVERRDKKGFPTPIGVWFRGELRGWLREKLLHPDSGCRYVYRTDFLRLALAAHDLGPDMSSILWPALNIALWFEQFRAGVDW